MTKPAPISVRMRDGGAGDLGGGGTDTLAILLPPDSVSHRLLSGPVVISQGMELGVGTVNSAIAPKGVIRPIKPPKISVNQRLPSGPAVIPCA
jgi:hypothetical protein